MLLVEFCSPILVGEVPCDQLMRPLLLRFLCKLVSSSIGSVTLEIRLSHRSLALAAPAILGLVQVGWRLIAVVGIVGKVIPRTLMMVANRLILVLFFALVVMSCRVGFFKLGVTLAEILAAVDFIIELLLLKTLCRF
jgi:hypothetical protein